MHKDPIIELNRLWVPVRPYLAQQIDELYGRHDGRVLEAGPFSGLAFELARRGIGTSFHMAVFPGEIVDALEGEARELGLGARVTIAESDHKLSGVPAGAFDLIVFRGAFFFPSFFEPDVKAIYRSLKAGGTALLGGGFGRHTPKDIIRGIEKRSKDLNQALGRVRITEEELLATLESAGLKEASTVLTEGGLWVLLRREFSPGTQNPPVRTAQAGVPVEQEPHHRIIFKNRNVRIYDAQIPPGDSTLFHTHSFDSVSVIAGGGQGTNELIGESPVEFAFPTGDAVFNRAAGAPYTHQLRNVGPTPLRFVVAELLATAGSGGAPANLDNVAGHMMVLENDRVKVYRVSVEPGESTGIRVRTSPWLRVSTTQTAISIRTAGMSPGTNETHETEAGDFRWYEGPTSDAIENVGSTTYQAIEIEWK